MSTKGKKWRASNPEGWKLVHKRYRDKLRDQVFEAYGNLCECCHEGNREFLALDHVEGGGNAHRRALCKNGTGRGGTQTLYRLVRDLGFPDTYRLLCHNCNHSYGAYGYCPHQETGDVKR